MTNQVRVECNDSQIDVVDKINRVLRQRGLALVDDGLPHVHGDHDENSYRRRVIHA